MDEEEMFDMHMCLVCHSTVMGLVNYINHKKYDCPGKRQNNPSAEKQNLENNTEKGDNPQTVATSAGNFSQNNSTYSAGHTVQQENKESLKSIDADLGTVIALHEDDNFSRTTIVSKSGSVATPRNCSPLSNAEDSVTVSSALQSPTAIDKGTILSNIYSPGNVISHTGTGDTRNQVNLMPSLSTSITNASSAISVDIQDSFSNFRTETFSPVTGNAVDPNMVMSATGRQSSASDRPEDFFSSLALQSKSQQANSVLGQSHIGRDIANDNNLTNDLPISNILNNLNFSSDDEDIDFSFSEDDLFDDAFSDDDDDDDFRPPRNHTKGKWKPGQGPVVPQTGGKWKPGQAPPPQHTGGKWRPGQRPMHYSSGKWKPGQSVFDKMSGNTRKKRGRPPIQNKSFIKDQEYFCTACNLYFRNRFSYSSHCTGRQHKENVIIGKCYDNTSEVETLGSIVTENVVTPEFETLTTEYSQSNDIPVMSTEEVISRTQEPEMDGKDTVIKRSEHILLSAAQQNDNSALKMQVAADASGKKGQDLLMEKNTQNTKPEIGAANTVQISVDDDVPCPLLVCMVCDKKFYSKYVLARHLLSSYHINRAKGNPNALRVLQQYHKYIVKLSPFQCAICPFYFNREEDLKDHLLKGEHVTQIKNITGQLICTLCKFTSFSNEEILKHLDAHPPHQESAKKHRKPCIIKERHYKAECKYCGKVMHSRMHMKRHVNFKHTAELYPEDVERQTHSKYRCLICMEVFWKYNKFNRHMAQKHQTEDELYCKLCKRKLSDKSAFQRHLKGLKHQEKLIEEAERKRDKSDATFDVGKFEVIEPSQDSVDDHESEDSPQTASKGMKIILRAVAKPRRKRKKRDANDNTNKIYKCDHCEHSVTKYADLRPHYMEVHSSEILVCELCDVSFISEKALKHHNQSKLHQNNLCEAEISQTQEVFSCEICKRRFSDEGWKQFHVEVYHLHPNSEEALQTKTGHVDITTQQYGQYLQSLHHLDRDEKVTCPECSKNLKKEHLLEHLRLHTGDKPFSCRHCNFAFVSALSLRRHLLSHMGLTERKCEECGKEYKKISSYKEHMLQHQMQKAGKQKFMCDICGQAFYLQKQLNNHMRRHGERKFKCPFDNCPWKFYFSNELESHIRSHTREKPFLCDICGYAAATKNRLLRHSRTHTGERKFHCEYCTYKAGTSTHLRRHMRIHIGSKPYKCPYCDYSCNTHENIRKHIVKTKKHAGLHIYPCKFCTFGTNKVTEFREHLASNHPEDFDGKMGGEGLAEMTGLYKKEQDPRKPSEGMRIVPAKERRERIHKKPVIGNKKKIFVSGGVKGQDKGQSEYGDNDMMMSEHGQNNWHVEIEKETRDAAAILASASSSVSALHHLHHPSNFHSSLGLVMSSGSYGYYPEAHGGNRSKVESSYIPNGSTDGVIRIETQHSSLQSDGERPELIIDYLEMDVQNA